MSKETRDSLSAPENYQLEAFAFSHGSFALHMQSSAPPDLFGYVEISQALETIDGVVELAATPPEAVQKVAELGGHFASAYKDLLKFISETETPLEYEWAAPDGQALRDTGFVHRLGGRARGTLLTIFTRCDLQQDQGVIL